MRILAMDTATSACSVALWCDGAVSEHRFSKMVRGQAEALVPMIDDVLCTANVAAGELDLLAVTVGPGAFTGLRIGLATARGMALAADIPCLGLTTTEVIAAAIDEESWPGQTLLVVLDSKRSDIYVQRFSAPGQAEGEALAMEPEYLGSWLGNVSGPVGVVGDAATIALAALAHTHKGAFAVTAPGVPDAVNVAILAARRWSPADPVCMPGPLYLRPPDAKLPRDGGRLRP